MTAKKFVFVDIDPKPVTVDERHDEARHGQVPKVDQVLGKPFKMPDGRLCVDEWFDVDGSRYLRLWQPGDHPDAGRVAPEWPAAYRNLFKQSVQLAMLRADYSAVWAGYRAWSRYERECDVTCEPT